MSRIVRVLPLFVILVAACASSPAGRPGTGGAPTVVTGTSTGVLVRLEDPSAGAATVIDADAATVWDALPWAFEGVGIPAGVLDEQAMTYGNPRFTGTRIGDRRTQSFVRCAGTGTGLSAAGDYRIRLMISSRVEAQADGRSLLFTSVSGTATTVEGTSTAPIRCVSDGQLEALIASAVAGLVPPR